MVAIVSIGFQSTRNPQNLHYVAEMEPQAFTLASPAVAQQQSYGVLMAGSILKCMRTVVACFSEVLVSLYIQPVSCPLRCQDRLWSTVCTRAMMDMIMVEQPMQAQPQSAAVKHRI